MARRSTVKIPETLVQYYANSVGGSIIEAYRRGKIIHVDTAAPRPREDTEAILQAEADLRAIEDEINAAYWLFSRSANRWPGRLTDPDLYARRNAARERLLDLRRQNI